MSERTDRLPRCGQPTALVDGRGQPQRHATIYVNNLSCAAETASSSDFGPHLIGIGQRAGTVGDCARGSCTLSDHVGLFCHTRTAVRGGGVERSRAGQVLPEAHSSSR